MKNILRNNLKVLLALLVLLSVILAGCTGAETSSLASSEEEGRKSAHTKMEPGESGTVSNESAAVDTDEESGTADGAAYTENGFALKEAALEAAPEGLGAMPVDTAIVFAINNIIDSAVTMTTDRDNLLIFSAEYEMDSAASGILKVVVKDDNGQIYTRENDTDFAEAGTNTFQALIITDDALRGTYTLQWFIDGMLACETSFTK